MKIHEFQAKELFRDFGIPVPSGTVATTPSQAVDCAKSVPGPPWVVKAQIHAGGRGKGGGVRLANSFEEVEKAADEILSHPLITPQTGASGQKVHQLLIEEGLDIDKEFYLGIVIDRKLECPAMIFSQAGGMEIEEVSAQHPELVLIENIDIAHGLMPYQTRNFFYVLEPLPDKSVLQELSTIMTKLYALFISKDCSLVEINPLVITKSGKIVALDAKINFDDNALFRQKEIAQLHDPYEMDELEARASEHNLNYIRLDGNVGAMVNGAGLAMATMDVIKLAGAEPANFLDVGGGASEEMVTNGIKIILSDKRVKAILINIFGGIMRCDVLARGVVKAAKEVEINVPLIVRLEGTNVEEGRAILQNSDLDFSVAQDMEEAAKMVAEQVS
ncbi:MAG: ADP-forming succinate--CoA ligase subunit beta [Deltaproteobacteria bacterium]|nr:MAG: ADP-forming succinate--CoA ligase subunit beta [Deltaproteobacteria bacterium]